MVQHPLHVVILAAGKGSRMHSQRPKVLHKVAGKALLGHVIDSALGLTPAQVHVVVGHGKEQVMSEFEAHPHRKALNFVVQEEQLGTGHAVSQALPNIPDDAHVLMLTADVPLIKTSTLQNLVDSMQHHSLAVLTALVDNPTGLGRITRDESHCVSGIVEEKDASAEQRQINEINSGIICARKQALTHWLNQVQNHNKQAEYYLTDVVGLAYADGAPITTLQPTQNHEVNGINDRVQLAAAECAFQHQQAEAFMRAGVTIIDPARIDIRGDVQIGQDTIIDVNAVIEGATRIGNNVNIGPNCVISNSIIADGAIINANSVLESAEVGVDSIVGPFARLRPGTRLAEGVKVGNFVETKNTYLSPGAKVNHLSYVGDAHVGSRTNIGAGVITCNYDGVNKHKTTIGNDVFVGSNCQLVAPVVINDGATIGAGSTITVDVEAEQLVVGRSKQRVIPNWKRPTKKTKQTK